MSRPVVLAFALALAGCPQRGGPDAAVPAPSFALVTDGATLAERDEALPVAWRSLLASSPRAELSAKQQALLAAAEAHFVSWLASKKLPRTCGSPGPPHAPEQESPAAREEAFGTAVATMEGGQLDVRFRAAAVVRSARGEGCCAPCERCGECGYCAPADSCQLFDRVTLLEASYSIAESGLLLSEEHVRYEGEEAAVPREALAPFVPPALPQGKPFSPNLRVLNAPTPVTGRMISVVAGALDKDKAAAVVNAGSGALTLCQERVRLREPSFAGGKLVLELRLDPGGAAASVRVASSTVASAALEACTMAVAKGWRFPPAKQATTFRVPILFNPTGY